MRVARAQDARGDDLRFCWGPAIIYSLLESVDIALENDAAGNCCEGVPECIEGAAQVVLFCQRVRLWWCRWLLPLRCLLSVNYEDRD